MSPPASPISRGTLSNFHSPPVAGSRYPTSSVSPTLMHPGASMARNAGELLDDDRFLKWLFTGEGGAQNNAGRIEALDEMLTTTAGLSATNIVLTNGFAADASRALRNLGLAHHFAAVCDTRGGVVQGPESAHAQSQTIHIAGGAGGRYSKTMFVDGCLFQPAQTQRFLNIPHVARVVYVDDDPERLDPSTSTTIRLPKEGSGIGSEAASMVVEATTEAAQQGGQVLVVFDFDCTLSMKHMFKAMHQPISTWAREWDGVAATLGSPAQAYDRGSPSQDFVEEKPIFL